MKIGENTFASLVLAREDASVFEFLQSLVGNIVSDNSWHVKDDQFGLNTGLDGGVELMENISGFPC